MTTAQHTRPTAQAQTKTIDEAAQLLDQVIANTRGGTYKVIERFFEDYIPQLEELLPDKMKGQGARLVKRALLTFEKSKVKKLKQCTPTSFIRCVLEAAELGLSIDGSLAHAVPYDNKKEDANGNVRWEIEAQLNIDYKGLLSIAKRTGQVVDGRADVVRQGDQFSHGRKNGQAYLEHTYAVDAERGEVIAAYGELTLPHGRYDYTLLQKQEVDRIRDKSKAKNAGPWVEWYDRMAAKSALRRALKTYCDDPQVQHAVELDEREYGTPAFDAPVVGKVHRSALNETLQSPGTGRSQVTSTPSTAPKTQAKAPTQTESSQTNLDGVDEPAGDEPASDDALAQTKQQIAEAFANADSESVVDELMDYWSDPQQDQQIRNFAGVCCAQARERFNQPAPARSVKKGAKQKPLIDDSSPDYYQQGQ